MRVPSGSTALGCQAVTQNRAVPALAHTRCSHQHSRTSRSSVPGKSFRLKVAAGLQGETQGPALLLSTGGLGLGPSKGPHGEWMEDLQVAPGAPATERELSTHKPDVRTRVPGQWCQLRVSEEEAWLGESPEGSKLLCGRECYFEKKKSVEQEPATTWGNGGHEVQEVLHVGDEAPRPRSGRQAACPRVPGTPGMWVPPPQSSAWEGGKRQVCTCLKSRTSDHTHLLAPPATSGRPPFLPGLSSDGSRGAVSP